MCCEYLSVWEQLVCREGLTVVAVEEKEEEEVKKSKRDEMKTQSRDKQKIERQNSKETSWKLSEEEEALREKCTEEEGAMLGLAVMGADGSI